MKPSATTPPHSPEDSTPTVAFPIKKPAESNKPDKSNKPMFDWEAWRARTGGADGRAALADRAPAPAAAEDGQPDREAGAARGGWSRRSGVAVLAIAAVCALLGGFAAFAATLGGPAPSPAAALSIAPGDVTGTLAPGATVGPHQAHDGDSGQGGTHHGSPDPSLSPLRQPTGQPTGQPAGQPTSQPAGQPTAGSVPAGQADPFSAAVTGYLAGRAGTVLAAIYDVRTGQTWTLGDGRPQATGSLVKVDILQALLARRPLGLSAADRARARSMIENNVNAPATALWNQVGRAAGLRSFNASVGLLQTTPSTCLVCAGFGWPGWGLTTTTPVDQLLLLRQFVNGTLLSPAGRGYALSLMENVEPDQRWGVSAGVPPGVRVALKNAWVPLTAPNTDWQVNSEGWISGDGRNYLIAVLATGNPDQQYGIDTINTLSAIVWPAMQ
jgi:PT repeat/Beta-lactamase enzyme family